MATHAKLLMAALTAALVLSIGASTATALRSISLSNAAGEVKLTGILTFVAGNISWSCNITLEKTLSSIIPKTVGALIGKITRVDFERPERCRVEGAERLNTIRILGTGAETPNLSRIFYNGFIGRLPNPEAFLFLIRNMQMLIEIRILGITVSCLYEGETGVSEAVNAEGVIGRLRSLRNSFALISGPFGCPATEEFRFELEPERRIRITLL